MSVRKDIREQLPEGATVFDNYAYDDSIIGVTTDGRVVYSYEKMIEELAVEEGLTREEARDWIEYNTIKALPYIENAPVIVEEIIV